MFDNRSSHIYLSFSHECINWFPYFSFRKRSEIIVVRAKTKRERIINARKKNIQPKNKLNNEYKNEKKKARERELSLIKKKKERESFRFMQILHTKLFVLGVVCTKTSLFFFLPFFFLYITNTHKHINFTAKLKHAYSDEKNKLNIIREQKETTYSFLT